MLNYVKFSKKKSSRTVLGKLKALLFVQKTWACRGFIFMPIDTEYGQLKPC